MDHIYKKFSEELANVRAHFAELGDIVRLQVINATGLLTVVDLEVVEQIIKSEKTVNKTEVAIDSEITQIIARSQPAAGDLRLLISASKALSDLERVGDEAQKIAKIIRDIHIRGDELPADIDLKGMAEVAISMLAGAIDAFCQTNVEVAADISSEDKQLDGAFADISKQLIEVMKADTGKITLALEMMTMAKSFERIGDHAKNIAQYIVYLVYGRDVRHLKAGKLRKKIETLRG